MALPAPVYPDHFKGVKNLIDNGCNNIPPMYVLPPQQRSLVSSACHGPQLPLIDIQELHGHNRSQIVQAIRRACEEWGFFQVINHGVSPDIMDKMYDVSLEFFSLPLEEKMHYFSSDIRSHMRYSTSFNPQEDKILNWRDFLRFSFFPLEEMMPLWPDKPSEFRHITAEFGTQVRGLIEIILEAISESLGLERDYIQKAFGTPSQIIALNYYPPCASPDLVFGLPPHSDPGGISVLMQDQVGGLEIQHQGSWVAVKPVPHSFVVNIADQIQILSNGRYQSVEHRAIVNGNKARLSIVNANGPSFDTVIAPAPELVDETHRPIYKESLYGDFMAKVQSKSLCRRSVLDTLRILQ